MANAYLEPTLQLRSEQIAALLKPMELPPLSRQPLVSVLIANYNYAQYIGEAIESVLRQTYQNFEIVICDDGSTDESCEVIERYRRLESRLKLVRKQNAGQISASNAAFKHSEGEILCFLDADDIFLEGKLSAVVQAFIERPQVGLVAHRVIRIDRKRKRFGTQPLLGRIPTGWLGPRLVCNGAFLQDLPPTTGLSLRREVAAKVFPLPEERGTYTDTVICKVVPLCTNIFGMEEAYSEYRLHGTNSHNRVSFTTDFFNLELNSLESLWRIRMRYLESLNLELGRLSAPFDSNMDVLMCRYAKALLEGDCACAQYHTKLINHPEFNQQPLMRRLFWVYSVLLPKRLFGRALSFLFGQSSIKQMISNVQRLTAIRK